MILNYLKHVMLPLLLSSGSFVYGQLTAEWEIFNESNSLLPNNTIRCLETDQENNVWVGTDWGLAKLSNGVWQIFNKANSGLTDNSIRAIDSDSQNNIWIGTTLGGLFKFDGANWTQYNSANSDIPCDFIRAITVDSTDRIWIGTIEGLSLFDGSQWQNWTISNSGILSNNITSIRQGKNGMMYVATINGGVYYIQNSVLTNYTLLQNGVPDNTNLSVQVDNLGNPWFASAAQGFFTDVGNLTWMVFNVANSPLPSNSLKCMILDKDQNFFIGTHLSGLVIRTNNNDWRNYTKTNSLLPDNQILALSKDSSGNLWIGTYSEGLVRLKEGYLGLGESHAEEVNISPVPARETDEIRLILPNANCSFNILDQLGRIVFSDQPKTNSILIPSNSLVPGTYYIVLDGNNFKTTKIVII